MIRVITFLCIFVVFEVRSEPIGTTFLLNGSTDGDEVASGFRAVAYDETWPNAAVYEDVYKHNVWDPEIEPDQLRNRSRTVQGRVDYVERIRLEDRKRIQAYHYVARVTLASGRTVLIELGEEEPGFRFTPGAKVRIQGVTGRINGRQVLVAHSVESDGRKWMIHRDPATSPTVRFSGIVDSLSPVRLTNKAGETQEFTEIALRNGYLYLTNLRRGWIEEAGIHKGEEITVRGRPARIRGRSYLRVADISVDGKTRRVL